jgi:hypothetical protein
MSPRFAFFAGVATGILLSLIPEWGNRDELQGRLIYLAYSPEGGPSSFLRQKSTS